MDTSCPSLPSESLSKFACSLVLGGLIGLSTLGLKTLSLGVVSRGRTSNSRLAGAEAPRGQGHSAVDVEEETQAFKKRNVLVSQGKADETQTFLDEVDDFVLITRGPDSDRITAPCSDDRYMQGSFIQSPLGESSAVLSIESKTKGETDALTVKTSSNSQGGLLNLSSAQGKVKCVENVGINHRSEDFKGKGKCIKNTDILGLPVPLTGNISAVGTGQAEKCAVTTSECPEFRGVQFRGGKFVAEIRPALCRNGKIWLGTFETAEEAAAAYDVGIYYCRKRIPFNFPDSPSFLQGTHIPQDLVTLKDTIQQQSKVAAERIRRAAPIVTSPSAVLEVETPSSSVYINSSLGPNVLSESVALHTGFSTLIQDKIESGGYAEQVVGSTHQFQGSTCDVTSPYGIQLRPEHNKWVVEIRSSSLSETPWMRSYNTLEEAEAAYEVGLFFHCKKIPNDISNSLVFLPTDTTSNDLVDHNMRGAASTVLAPAVVAVGTFPPPNEDAGDDFENIIDIFLVDDPTNAIIGQLF